MFKIITHVAVFAIGAGSGIYWGVHHQDQADQVAAWESQEAPKVQAAAAQAKIDVLNKIMASQQAAAQPQANSGASGLLGKGMAAVGLGGNGSGPNYAQMLLDAQNDLNSAKSKMNQ
jgi:hypothetical protein